MNTEETKKQQVGDTVFVVENKFGSQNLYDILIEFLTEKIKKIEQTA
jgi:hypothetical protein